MPWIGFTGSSKPEQVAEVLGSQLEKGSVLPDLTNEARSLLTKLRNWKGANTSRRTYITPRELEVWLSLPGWGSRVSYYGEEPLVLGGDVYAEYPDYARPGELPPPPSSFSDS